MIFSTMRSRYPIYMLYNYPKSRVSIFFTLGPVVFESRLILRQVHRIALKWHWIAKRSNAIHNYKYYVLLVPHIPHFIPQQWDHVGKMRNTWSHFNDHGKKSLKLIIATFPKSEKVASVGENIAIRTNMLQIDEGREILPKIRELFPPLFDSVCRMFRQKCCKLLKESGSHRFGN